MYLPASTTTGSAAQTRSERFVGLALLVGIVAAVIVLALLAWLAREMLAGQTLHFDTVVRNTIHGFASARITAVMLVATRLGSPTILVPIGVLCAAGFFAVGWRRAAALLPLTMLGAGLLDTILKESFRRVRPAAFFDYPLPTSYSFPSGHALFGFCFFVVLAVLLSPRVKQPAFRLAIWALALFAAFMIGVSRIYLGVHYPSDVLAGWGSGFVLVVAVAFGDRVAHRIKHGIS